MGISTKEDRAQTVREELEELKERYEAECERLREECEEECAYLWRTKYELDCSYLEQKIDRILGII